MPSIRFTRHALLLVTLLSSALFLARPSLAAQQFVIVSNDFGNSVQMYDLNGAFVKAFVPAGFGELASPQGICVGADNTVYVSSATNDRVLHYANDGSFLGAINGGGLDQPWYCTFGPDHNLYVSSSLTSQVLCYDAAGNYLRVAATGGGLFRPDGLGFDRDGNLLVSDFYAPNSNIKKYNPATGAFLGDVVDDPGLVQPLEHRLSADGSTLYVCSFGTNEVRSYNVATGAFLGVFNGPPLNGPVGQLVLPGGGDLLVTSWNTSAIYKFNPLTGAAKGVFASGGTLNHPNDLAVLTVPEPATSVVVLFSMSLLALRRRNSARG